MVFRRFGGRRRLLTGVRRTASLLPGLREKVPVPRYARRLLERRDRLHQRHLTPQLVDEVIQGDDSIRAQQQDAEHSTLLGTAQIEEPPSGRHLERPENPELHLSSRSPPVKVVRTPYKDGATAGRSHWQDGRHRC